MNTSIARVLAYLLEYAEGIVFSRGVSEPEEPMLSVRDLTGKIQSWIEIGTPDSARLHKASKAADRVVVYCHKEGAQWLKGLAAAAVHRADALELYAIDRGLIAELVSRLDRRMAFGASINERDSISRSVTRTSTAPCRPSSFSGRRSCEDRQRHRLYADRYRSAGVHHAIVNVQPICAGDRELPHPP